jgi:hypothetical protein
MRTLKAFMSVGLEVFVGLSRAFGTCIYNYLDSDTVVYGEGRQI